MLSRKRKSPKRVIFASVCPCFPLFAQQGHSVPFVGCKSDGQQGPVDAPHGESKVVPVTAQAAQRLAWYQADPGLGVLAPRGWHCFGLYGSAAVNLYVSPEPFAAEKPDWRGFSGPAIELSNFDGETSGRFEVASTIARVFPAHTAFVREVEQLFDFWRPESSAPYPTDKLTYKSKEVVEYETPAQTQGLGTQFRLGKSAGSIRGVAILAGDAPSLLQLSVRLPRGLDSLTPVIIRQVERDAAAQRY